MTITKTSNKQNTIVTAKWLQDNINNPNLILLDASLDTTASGQKSEYEHVTITNARKFDLKNVFKDTSSKFPNTAPSTEVFQHECRKLGINQNANIVVFDHFGVYSSPRVWWLFNLMGHTNISVLDGGLPEWINNGFEVAEKSQIEPLDYPMGKFTAHYQPSLLISFEDVVKNIETKAFTIVDARSHGRFEGTADDPRKHLQSGHIPNSVNLPYQMVLDETGKFKTLTELTSLFDSVTKYSNQLVFSCGSGMTACIIMLASNIALKESKKIYDGSWTEWAELKGLTK